MELTIIINDDNNEEIQKLMNYYNVDKPENIIKKSLSLLKIAAHIHKNKGELIARSEHGRHETKILT